MRLSFLIACLISCSALAAPQLRESPPSPLALRRAQDGSSTPYVKLRQGTLNGTHQTIDGVKLDLFLGVPFAKPPVGSLRFAAPVPVSDSENHEDRQIDASTYGPACPQIGASVATSEDCLTINIIRPSASASHDKLPVLYWIYGGAFTTGASALYNGTRIVAASVKAGKPIVWVSANYRVGPWGFMAGTEFTDASRKDPKRTTLNAGLHDQRAALKWVQKNIAKLGGDSDKVTLWGQSAGSISVAIQLVANGGDTQDLFHAAYMTSGSPGYGGILSPSHSRMDATWKTLTDKVGCGDSRANSSTTSKLECLRQVNLTAFSTAAFSILSAASTAPPAGNLVWAPHIDGYFLSDRPSRIYASGKVADVPIVSGDMNDEGTVLISAKTVPDEAAFKNYTRSFLVINDTPDTDQVLSDLYQLYPNDVTQGSPFPQLGTNGSQATANASDPLASPSTNQFKRLAALFGDYAFQSQRRYFLNRLEMLQRNGKRKSPIWAYIDRQIDYGTNATRGAYHSADIVYYLGNTVQRNSSTLVESLHQTMQRSLISFVNSHDPTKLDKLDWPQYGSKALLKQWKADNITIVKDSFRSEAIAFWFKDRAAAVFNF